VGWRNLWSVVYSSVRRNDQLLGDCEVNWAAGGRYHVLESRGTGKKCSGGIGMILVDVYGR
jgi:hypothetical protein